MHTATFEKCWPVRMTTVHADEASVHHQHLYPTYRHGRPVVWSPWENWALEAYRGKQLSLTGVRSAHSPVMRGFISGSWHSENTLIIALHPQLCVGWCIEMSVAEKLLPTFLLTHFSLHSVIRWRATRAPPTPLSPRELKHHDLQHMCTVHRSYFTCVFSLRPSITS